MKDNPKKTVDLLKEAWKLEKIEITFPGVSQKTHYIAKADYDKMNNKLSISYYYHTHVFPQPFFGNIENPKIIVLAKNPRYKKIESENEIDNLNLEKYIDDPNVIFGEGGHTKKWWNESFKELIFDENFDIFLNNVGIFNLCGYHSETYFDVPKRILKDMGDYKVLPTQQVLKEHLKELINVDNLPIVIVIWGMKEWKSFLGENIFEQLINQEKLLVVNEGQNVSKQNHSINKAKKYKDFEEKLKELINNKG